jgi:hypothetical protein
MSTVRETKEYQGISADEAYKLAEMALEQSGFEIWKRRPLGWLVMADFSDPGGPIKGNASCRPADGASITLTLDSGNHEESALYKLVETFFEVIDQKHEK